jgi:hypothetical protein
VTPDPPGVSTSADKKEKEATVPEKEFQFEQIKPGMDLDTSQRAVSAILSCLRNQNTGAEVVSTPPTLPANATPAQQAVFAEQEERYVAHLLEKPSGALTAHERKYLTKAVADYARSERA